MHHDLEQLIKTKSTTTPVHRGEVRMDTKLLQQKHGTFFSDLFSTPLPGTTAIAYLLFAASAVMGLSMQLGPEAEILAAIEQGPNVHSRVLGASSEPIFLDLKIDGSDEVVYVAEGDEVLVKWYSEGARTCTLSPLGFSATFGAKYVTPSLHVQTYSVTCSGPGGKAAFDSVTVKLK